MKKLLPVLLAVFLSTACQKQITYEQEPKTPKEIAGIAARGASEFVVCHKTGNGSYQTISINVNALPAHLAHGDIVPDADGDGYTKLNPCGNGSQDDCNDDDPAINAGATEICDNNIDDNCDGNVDENCTILSVTICNQVWMLKNLDVDKFRDGTPIPQATTDAAWRAATPSGGGNPGTPACCYYDNDPSNGAVYGKLYNWTAVNDPRGLAPVGWHVASAAEWEILGNCLSNLDPSTPATAMMKETGTAHWPSPNDLATNISGFTALPGGERVRQGPFASLGIFGAWWTSTEVSPILRTARVCLVSENDGPLFIGTSTEGWGFSVRCLKD